MRRAASGSGMTLVEMLVVISIIGLLMAIGMGAWISFRSSSRRQSAFRGMVATCRRARVFALEETAPSRMVLYRAPGRPPGYRAEGLRLVGFWHLEGSSDVGRPGGRDPQVGFAGKRLEQSGGIFFDRQGPVPGFRGTGMQLDDGGRVILPTDGLELPRGGQLACCLQPKDVSRKQVVFSRGRELELVLEPRGALRARVGSAEISTEPYRLLPGRWSRVALFYTPEETRITVDGVVRARTGPKQPPDMPDEKELGLPVVMGEGEWLLSGCVDEISVHRLVREQDVTLPPDARLEGDCSEIRFDAAGMLDREFHNGPVRVDLSMPGSGGGRTVRRMIVTLMGEIREEVLGEQPGR